MRKSHDLLTFQNQPSAELAAERLRSEGVPATVEVQASLLGLVENVFVLVPKDLEHRAIWILKSSKVPDNELDFLATGELSNDDKSDS